MARKVFISSGMSIDPALAAIAQQDVVAALLWPWILTAFDDWGRAKDDAIQLKLQVVPGFAEITVERVEQALTLYAEAGLIRRYQVGGRRYMCIEPDKWFRYQTHIHREKRTKDDSVIPPPPVESLPAEPVAEVRALSRDRAETREATRGFADSSASPSSLPPFLPSPSPSPSPSPTEDPPLPFADANGLPPADAAGAAPHRPTDAEAAAPQPRPAPRRLDPAIRALVKTWRDELTAQGIPLPRDWHLVAGGILTGWIQAGRDVTSLADWWTWARDHPYWVRRRHEPDLWWRSYGEWRASQGAPLPRDRPNGRPRQDWLAGAAAVEALLHADRGPPPATGPPDDEEGRTDDPP